MKPAKIFRMILLGWLIVCLTGCAATFSSRYKSSEIKPTWVTYIETNENAKEICFVGMSSNVEIHEFIKGRDDAVADALNQAACYVGLKSEANFVAKSEGASGGATNVITYTAKAKITDSRMKGIYYEMWQSPSGAQYCDIFVLVSFNTAQLKQERERLSKEKSDNIKKDTVVVDEIMRQPNNAYYVEIMKQSELKEKAAVEEQKPDGQEGRNILNIILGIFFPKFVVDR